MAERVGFIGLGIMGSRMAANLCAAGFDVAVWNRTAAVAEEFATEHDCGLAGTPAELAARSEIVVTMVVDGPQVAELLLGPDGVAAGAEGPLLCVDMSTIAPAHARDIAAGLATRGLRFMDAPVSGSSPRAEDGTLTIMAGGDVGDFERARPLFEAMGELIVHVGSLGHGQMIKLINNAVAAANAVAVAEALLVGKATGVNLDALERVMGAGSAASAMLELKAGPMRRHDFETLFRLSHMLKDVRLCLEEAGAARVPFPTAAHARELLTAAEGRGLSDEDFAGVVEAVEGLAGFRL